MGARNRRGPIVPTAELEAYERAPANFRQAKYCQYRADSRELGQQHDEESETFGWQTGIHMPRWASRIDLLITGVRASAFRRSAMMTLWRKACRPIHIS